jgi:hypothetical protein
VLGEVTIPVMTGGRFCLQNIIRGASVPAAQGVLDLACPATADAVDGHELVGQMGRELAARAA